MLKDDAKFFFCLSGFTGFSVFFSVSFFLHQNAVLSLVYGTIGCLFFSITGRFLLGFVLKGQSAVVNNTEELPQIKRDLNPDTAPNQKPRINETEKSMSEAVTKVGRKVDARK